MLRSLIFAFILVFVACKPGDESNNVTTEVASPTEKSSILVRVGDEVTIISPAKYDSLQRDYITKYAHTAQSMMRKYGVPASVLLAQGLHESQAGTSKLARENYNHFAVQCYSSKCGEGHCSDPKGDGLHKTFFRIYPNPWYGWEAHAQRLSRDLRYAKYLPQEGVRYSAYVWTRALQDNNFSADRQYGEKLYDLIKKYNLEDLDEKALR